MHISEGVLIGPVLAGGYGLSAVGVMVGLKKLDDTKVARAAVLAAAFFVASLIHVPVGPANVHLILSGLVGILMGWAAFPIILTALLLQAIFFQFGGLTTLGVNTFIMALPAVFVSLLCGRAIRAGQRSIHLGGAFVAGALAVFLSASLAALSLTLSGGQFVTAAQVLVVAHLPLMLVEGGITALCIGFLHRVKPGILLENNRMFGEAR